MKSQLDLISRYAFLCDLLVRAKIDLNDEIYSNNQKGIAESEKLIAGIEGRIDEIKKILEVD